MPDDDPLLPGAHEIPTLAPRIIDLMLGASEAMHVVLGSLNGAKIVRLPIGYASSFDRHMSVATRARLYDDGYKATRSALSS